MSTNKTLISMVGLPRSGKSTFCNELGYPIVCPDAIRLALHGERFIAKSEPYVWAIADTMVNSLFLAGHDIVLLDSCSLSEKRRAPWINRDYKTLFIHLHTPVAVCKERASGDDVILSVIDRMNDSTEKISHDFVIDCHDNNNPVDMLIEKLKKQIYRRLGNAQETKKAVS